MCLAIPGKVETITGDKGLVDIGGVCKEISFIFIPEVKEGDWILIHTGFGLNIISEKDALDTIDLLREAYGPETIP